MKILTIVGARPQFIKAAVVSRALQKIGSAEEIIVHTGQHYDERMSEVFFKELEIPKPKYNLGIHDMPNSMMLASMISEIHKVISNEKPDLTIVYGDTNSTLAGAIASRQNHVMLAHVEAGLRSYNMRMPEEFNRILTDRISEYLFCPTQTAIDNLHEEGYANFKCRIILSGDVMFDASLYYKSIAEQKSKFQEKDFILVTVHRSENVDYPEELKGIVDSLNTISTREKIVLPLHPRTKKQLVSFGLKFNFPTIEPVSYLDMIQLLSHCKLVMTDSGGLQKEAFFFKKPCITLRDTTEWVELLENKFNVLAGTKTDDIISCYEKMSKSDPDFDMNLYGNGHAGDFIAHSLLNQ